MKINYQISKETSDYLICLKLANSLYDRVVKAVEYENEYGETVPSDEAIESFSNSWLNMKKELLKMTINSIDNNMLSGLGNEENEII